MQQDATTLKYIKYAAVTISSLMVAGIATLMFLARETGEDITGIVAPALLLTFLSSIVAIVAAVVQMRRR
jgi:spore maturation protein SpmA